MAKGPILYSIGDREVTPEVFRALPRASKIDAMVEWFRANYEDPAERISYDGREGGYQWAGFGPYMAREQVPNEFGGVATGEEIETAIRRIEANGTIDWASTVDLDDTRDEDDIAGVGDPLLDWAGEPPFDTGVAAGEVADGDGDEWPPLIGVPAEARDLQAEVLAGLERFEAKLDAYAAQRAHRGHNRPPELLDDEEPLTDADLANGREAAVSIRAEAAKEEPDASVIVRAAAMIARIGRKLWGALRALGADVRGGIVGGIAYAYHEDLAAAAMDVASSAARWAEHLQAFW